ncbi:tolloid-like protein 1 [Centruroides vittatus]|uniref:tolloid-like protein 1 n=1 Tax=Centruroides vittatus TaxID=120091 RepID=UPI00350EBE35
MPTKEIPHSVERISYAKRGAVSEKWRLWDEAVVPYAIDPELPERTRRQFIEAAKHWESVTCLKFVPEEATHAYSIYVEPTGNCPCCSTLGRFSRRQTFVLHETCSSTGVIKHEIGHAIGFQHEQSRPDRDKYIKVLFENIDEEFVKEFEKASSFEIDSLGFGYDFQSIMHYPSNIFSKNGKATMESLNESTPITGNSGMLSKIDIAQTKKLYNCPACYFSLIKSRGILKSSEASEELSTTEGNECQWFIKVNDVKTISFTLDYTPEDENCSSEYLELRDGYWSKSPIIGRFCGNQTVQNTYTSTSNSILIAYKSSSNSSNAGFTLKYIESCGGRIEADEGTIESNQLQEYSSLTSDCQWIIVVPFGYGVAMKFESLNMESEENCTNEFVEIFEGEGREGESLGKYCGNELPDTILSTNNTVTVWMKSNKTSDAKDFSLSFLKELNECELPDKGGCSDICVNTIGGYFCECEEGRKLFPNKKSCGTYINECGGVLNLTEPIVIASPNFPESYPSYSDCTWKIANENVQFTFIFLDTEKGKKKCKDKIVITGSNIPKKTYCGKKKPAIFNVTGVQDLKMDFTSDRLLQKKGFAVLLEAI